MEEQNLDQVQRLGEHLLSGKDDISSGTQVLGNNEKTTFSNTKSSHGAAGQMMGILR